MSVHSRASATSSRFPRQAGLIRGGAATGREIFYLAADRTLMAVDLRGGATMEPATPRALFPISIGASVVPINERTLYAVTSRRTAILWSTRRSKALVHRL